MKGRRRNVCRFPPHSFPTYQSCAKKISALKTCLAWQEFGSDRNRICVQGLSQTAFRKLSVPTEIVFVWKVYAAAHLRGFGSEKLRFFYISVSFKRISVPNYMCFPTFRFRMAKFRFRPKSFLCTRSKPNRISVPPTRLAFKILKV